MITDESLAELAARIGHEEFCVQLAHETLQGAGYPEWDAAKARVEQALDEGDVTCYCGADEHSIGFLQGSDAAARREARSRGNSGDTPLG